MLINDKETLIELRGQRFHCAMDVTMNFIGGKWKTVVLWYLKSGTKRFSELRKRMPNITERILSLQLQQLEADGLIRREVLSEKPPLKVEYSLTEFGQSLISVLDAVALWGRELGRAEGRLVEGS